MTKLSKITTFLSLFLMIVPHLWAVTEDTVDISYILPSGGNFDDGIAEWVNSGNKDNNGFIMSTVYSYPTDVDPRGMIGLFCRGTSTIAAGGESLVQAILTTSTNYPLSLETVARDQIVAEFYVMGNPTTIFRDPVTLKNTTTFVNSTIFGNFQVQIYSAYPWKGPSYTYTRTPGVSPAFQEACSYTVFMPSVVSTTTIMMHSQMTTWTKFSIRFSPLHQDWYKSTFIILKYTTRTTQNEKTQQPFGPPFDTEILVDKIRLYAIRFKP